MVDAAVGVFARRGYHEASMDEIAERAQISKPMVYLYLGSKEALFERCLEQEFARMTGAIADAADPELAPAEQLWQGLHAVFDVVSRHRDGWVVLHRQGVRAAGRIGERAVTLRRELVDVVQLLLSRAAPLGRGHFGESELQMCAHALVGAAESVADWMADRPDVTAEAASRRLMTICWVGLGDVLDGQIWHPDRSNATEADSGTGRTESNFGAVGSPADRADAPDAAGESDPGRVD